MNKMSKKGDVIILPKGFISLKRSLWIDGLENVIITGYGIDETIISFKNQIEGSEGLKIINPRVFPDKRGCFYEVYNKKSFEELNIFTEFHQDNVSKSQKHVFWRENHL